MSKELKDRIRILEQDLNQAIKAGMSMHKEHSRLRERLGEALRLLKIAVKFIPTDCRLMDDIDEYLEAARKEDGQ